MKVEYDNRIIEAELVGFIPFSEPWGEYHLDDGRVLRFRATIYRVLKALTEKAPDGSDLYIIQASNCTVVNEVKRP